MPSKFAKDARDLIERYFPERQIFYRSRGQVVFIRFNKSLQLATAILVLAACAWVAYAAANLTMFDRVIAARDQRISDLTTAYRVLGEELESTQARFLDITRELEEKHKQLLELVDQRSVLERRLGEITSELNGVEARLDNATTERDSAIREGRRMASRVEKLEHRLGELHSVEARLDNLISERDLALEKGQIMASRVEAIENRLSELKESQRELIARVQERTDMNLGEIEAMIALTGLSADELLKDAVQPATGLGGPFVGLSDDAVLAMEFAYTGGDFEASVVKLEHHLNRWKGLHNVLQRLPVTSPLDTYYVASHYGKRRDPFSKKWAMHAGVDLAGSRKAPVWSTAPGQVTFAGRKGPYGRMVEIDHGYGLKTRYGHLSRILVKKGEDVGFRHKIGVMGNTGRSTGSHLHYEILFDGSSHDPEKFMKAGKYVFKG